MQRNVCPECGEGVVRDAEFCAECGIYLDWMEDGSLAQHHPEEADLALADAVRGAGTGRTHGAAEGATAPPLAGDAPTTPELPQALPAPRIPLDDAPAESGCPRCDTRRTPGLRFCSKCAFEFEPPTGPTLWALRPYRHRPWWRRIFSRRRTAVDRASLRAYRRSLPMRHRMFRLLVVALVVALAAGGVLALRGNPVAWLQARWYDVRGTVVDVPIEASALDPADAPGQSEFGPSLATDEDDQTAWATTWTGGEDPVQCGTRRAAEALQLTFADVVDLRALEVVPGLPSGDPLRTEQHRPQTLELRFSDGTCELVHLLDRGRTQRVDLDEPVSTSSVRVAVVDVYSAEGDSDLVAVSEIEFLARPTH
jgi:hypothetical protein